MLFEELLIEFGKVAIERDRYCSQQIEKPIYCDFPDDIGKKINLSNTYSITGSMVSGTSVSTTTTL